MGYSTNKIVGCFLHSFQQQNVENCHMETCFLTVLCQTKCQKECIISCVEKSVSKDGGNSIENSVNF